MKECATHETVFGLFMLIFNIYIFIILKLVFCFQSTLPPMPTLLLPQSGHPPEAGTNPCQKPSPFWNITMLKMGLMLGLFTLGTKIWETSYHKLSSERAPTWAYMDVKKKPLFNKLFTVQTLRKCRTVLLSWTNI